jgi:hypothetical protein
MGLKLHEGTLKFDGPRPWTMAVADLRIIAELTTDYGPFLTDWLVVFVAADGTWHECPVDDSSIDVLGRLGTELGTGPLVPIELCGNADLRTRILWPQALTGRRLFLFLNRSESSWDERVNRAMVGEVEPERRVLTNRARRALRFP